MRRSVLAPFAFALLLLVPLACSLGRGSVDQVPSGIAERVEASRTRGGSFADPPLERAEVGRISIESFVARLEQLERANRSAADAASNNERAAAERQRAIERRAAELETALAAQREENLELVDALLAERRERQELFESLDASLEHGGVERAALAERVGAAERAATGAAQQRDTGREALAALAALESRVAERDEALDRLTAQLETEREAARQVDRRHDDRLTEIERGLDTIGERLIALEPAKEVWVRLERTIDEADEFADRILALETGANSPSDARLEAIERALERIGESIEDVDRSAPDGVAELREEVAGLGTGIARLGSTPRGRTTMLGVLARADTAAFLTLLWREHMIWIVTIALALVLAVVAWSMRQDRTQRREAEGRLARVERALEGIAVHLEDAPKSSRRSPSSTTSVVTPPIEAAPPTRLVEVAPAPPPAPVVSEPVVSAPRAAESRAAEAASVPSGGSESRWDRFVDRVENSNRAPQAATPRTATLEPSRTAATRATETTQRKRVLDDDFLSQYRRRADED